jgi:hypothetical protein
MEAAVMRECVKTSADYGYALIDMMVTDDYLKHK